MKHSCEVIMDLLPLYHDGVCSEKSREMVEEHLMECESCKKALMEIRKEISAPNVSRQDAGRAWKALTRNLWIRRVTAGIMAVVLAIVLSAAGFFVNRWYLHRPIWMNADELNYGAYRLADGRVYVEFMGREQDITTIRGYHVERNDEADMSVDYAFRMGWQKAFSEKKPELWDKWYIMSGENIENLVLVGKNAKNVTVICAMDDELPPATEEMEQRVAEYDERMERINSMPGKGKE